MAESVFQYGKGLMIEVPDDAVRVVVRGRHTESVQDGPNETRTITSRGERLCEYVREPYTELIKFLSEYFGPAVIACSPWPRAILTAFLVTKSPQLQICDDLKLAASVKKAPAPAGSRHSNLYDHWEAEGIGLGKMLRRLADDPSLFGDQPVERALLANETFLRKAFPESRLVVAFDHEPIISLLAARYGASAEILGLDECQAMIFFLDKDGKVLSVQKFTPRATIEKVAD